MSYGQTLDQLGTDRANVFASNDHPGRVFVHALFDPDGETLSADEAERLGTILIQQALVARLAAEGRLK